MSGLFKKTTQISLVLIAFLSIIGITLAQGSVSNSISSIDLKVSPSNPSAGDSVVLTISSETLDLNSSKILWYIDGVVRNETTSKNITIKTKGDGQKTNIRVVAETLDGVIRETSRDISPAGVDLLIEPMSYAMPFYKGKPLFIKEGIVKIIAIPDITINGAKISSQNLNFNWSKEDYILGSNSGKGKNSIIINSTIPVRDINVGVQILDDTGNILAEKSKIILLNDPQILFYENNPLYGILYNNAITGSYYLGAKEELKVVAKPFSFSFFKDTSEEANFLWYINEDNIVPGGKINEITLRQTTGQKGTASILLNVSNNNKINQYTGGSFDVEFGQ